MILLKVQIPPPPLWNKICYFSPSNWRKGLKILQLFSCVASVAKRLNFFHILHKIVFKTLKLTNMCNGIFQYQIYKIISMPTPGKVKIFSCPTFYFWKIFVALLLLLNNFHGSPKFPPPEVLSDWSLRFIQLPAICCLGRYLTCMIFV